MGLLDADADGRDILKRAEMVSLLAQCACIIVMVAGRRLMDGRRVWCSEYAFDMVCFLHRT